MTEAAHRITLDMIRRFGGDFTAKLEPDVRALFAPPAAQTHAHVGATPEADFEAWKAQACMLQQTNDRQEEEIEVLKRENTVYDSAALEQMHRAEDLSAKLDRKDEDLAGALAEAAKFAETVSDELLAEQSKVAAAACEGCASAVARAAAGEAAAAAAFGALRAEKEALDADVERLRAEKERAEADAERLRAEIAQSAATPVVTPNGGDGVPGTPSPALGAGGASPNARAAPLFTPAAPPAASPAASPPAPPPAPPPARPESA